MKISDKCSPGFSLDDLIPIHKDQSFKREKCGVYHLKDSNKHIIKIGEEELLKEAFILSSVDSQYFPKLHSISKVDELWQLVMEYIPGISLKEEIQLDSNWNSKIVEIRSALDIAIGMALAFKSLHSFNFLHRDMNPDHIILNNGKISFIDLEACVPKSFNKRYYNTETYNGDTIGTWETMSPEEFEEEIGSELRISTNVYTLGTIIFQLVHGFSPLKMQDHVKFKNEDQYTKHLQYTIHKTKLIKSSSGHKGVDDLINKCIRKKASERYQSMDDLLTDLSILKGD